MADRQQQEGGGHTGGFRGFVVKLPVIHRMVTYFDKTPEALPTVKVCKLPSCNNPTYTDNNGWEHDFCGKTHAREYRSMEEAAQRQNNMMIPRLVTDQYVLGSSVDGLYTAGSMGTYAACSGQANVVPGHVVRCAGGGMSSYAAVAGPRVFGNGGGSSNAHYPRSTYGSGVNMVNNDGTIDPDVIRFYNRGEPNYEFTNFFPAPIFLDGKQWPTTEHYFQAQKFIGTPFTEVIRHFQRPREAFDYSRNHAVSRWRRKDWESVKINIMRKALLAKFTQHADLREMLLSTGDKYLIEHSPYDSFWGNGGDDSGENRLGLLLMEVRSELEKGREMTTADTSESSPSHHPSTYRETAQGSSAGGVSSESCTPPCSTCLVDVSTPEDDKNQGNAQHFKPDSVEQTTVKNSDNFASCELHPRPELQAHTDDSHVAQPPSTVADRKDAAAKDTNMENAATTDSTTDNDTGKTTTYAEMEITKTPSDTATKTAEDIATNTATVASSTGTTTIDTSTNIVAIGNTSDTTCTTLGNTVTVGNTTNIVATGTTTDTTTMVNTMSNTMMGNPTDTTSLDGTTTGQPGTAENSGTDIGSVKATPVVVKHEVEHFTANDVSEPDPTEQPTQTVDGSFQDKSTPSIQATNDSEVENGQASLQQLSSDTVESQSGCAAVEKQSDRLYEDMDTSPASEQLPQRDISVNDASNETGARGEEPMET